MEEEEEEWEGEMAKEKKAEEEDSWTLFSNSAIASSTVTVRVLSDYDAADESELSIREGELVTVLNHDPSGWWEGERQRDGVRGWFPQLLQSLSTKYGQLRKRVMMGWYFQVLRKRKQRFNI